MGSGLKYFLLVLFLTFSYIIGALIFTKGFLLKRVVVERNSSCQVDFALQADQHGEVGCWMHRRFSKAVIVIIDALRADFMIHDGRISDVPYRNKLPTIHQLLIHKPLNSRLYRFVADPPTTTLQRLKGLTTGSLPTFVDAGSNFAKTEITEDNFIDQFLKRNMKIKFFGDDTWLGLFPNRFFKAFPFPSFNVKDLHTVDNGILQHLLPEMRKSDWDVVIAHFLGVDHCGHRYGPNHPAMAEKLTQMDHVIRNITKMMSADTILFVMGDHGMTRTGDHGGDSKDELEAGLFVYSPAQITSSPRARDESDYLTVAQTDFVPTLSLLMGLPIPFSSIGKVITDLFNHCPWWKTGTSIKQVFHSVKALRLNAQQISQYLRAYMETSADFPRQKFTELEFLLAHAESDLQRLVTAMVTEGETDGLQQKLTILEDHYTTYISDVREMCQKVWAKFDTTIIFFGISTVFMSLLLNCYFIYVARSTQLPGSTLILVFGCLCFLIYVIVQTFIVGEGSKLSSFGFLLGGIDLLIILLIVVKVFTSKASTDNDSSHLDSKYAGSKHILSLENCASVVASILYFGIFFSNSYVVYEDSVTHFLSQWMVWVFCFKSLQHLYAQGSTTQKDLPGKKYKSHIYRSFDIMRILTHPAAVVVFMCMMVGVTTRLAVNFRGCREEQWNCTLPVFFTPLSSLSDSFLGSKNVRYFLSVGCLAAMVYLPRRWLSHYGNLNGSTPTVMCLKFFIPVAAVSCMLHWAVQGIPQTLLDQLPTWQQVLLPRIVYAIVVIAMVVMALNPLCIYLLPEDNSMPVDISGLSTTQLIPRVYNHLKLNWKALAQGSKDAEEKPPVVFGLATVFSGGVVYIVTVVSLLLSMLLGDGLAPSILLALLAAFLFLEIYTTCVKMEGRTGGVRTDQWSATVVLSLLSSQFFFATGHQTSITSIRWEAAFIGIHGDQDNYIWPTILIILNMFAAQVLFTVISPLIIFWPHTRGCLIRLFKGKDSSDEPWKGDFVLHEREDVLKASMFHLFSCWLLCNGIKLFGSMCAATMHRRHLMVWKIFAPRFVFEVASFCIVCGVALLMFAILLRINHSLGKWVEKLDKNK